jgi:hypothetical protein
MLAERMHGVRVTKYDKVMERSKQMVRKYMLSLCVAGLLAFPASLALACHLHTASVEVGCTQYKINVTAIGVSSSYSIRYTFILSPTTGGSPLTISSTIPITAQSGDFTDSVTNPLSLVGNYNAQLLSGSASLVANNGKTENTIQMTFSPTTLNCSPPA